MSTKIANKVALNSVHKHRVGAVITKGGSVVSTGYNQMRPSRLLNTPTLHAEAAAILKVLNEHRPHTLVGSHIFVSRWTKGGRIGLSKPCQKCSELIKSVGISSVTYTTNDGGSKRIRVESL